MEYEEGEYEDGHMGEDGDEEGEDGEYLGEVNQQG